MLPLQRAQAADPARHPSTPRWIWRFYAALGVLLAAYLVALMVSTPEESSTLVGGWLVPGFELVAAGLCLGRGLTVRRGRAIPLLLGAALLCWTTGDFVLTAESAGDATVSTPSLADAFYLCFYPLAYVGLALVIRRQVRSMVPATWLDGLVAGLGAAAVCAAFALNALVHTLGGTPLSIATDLAYPIGDLLLLALVVGGTALHSGRMSASWLLLAGACAMNAVGDTFNLIRSGGEAYSQVGSVFDNIAWPSAMVLVSMAMWMRAGRDRPASSLRAPGFLLPGLGAFGGLGILLAGSLRPVTPSAIALATATLVIVGVRTALSARTLRVVSEERSRQSMTDELTGLANRRHLFQVLDEWFARHDAPARRLGFLYVDLDHFKQVNDSFGHAAGDELLRQLGPRLSGALRDTDMLVRLGGDELGVVLADAHHDDAVRVAERLTARLEEPFSIRGVSVRVSASVGIAFAPQHAGDATALLHCADLAMYRAKLAKTTRFAVYREDIDESGNRLVLVEELHGAVAGGEFVLHYQPQLDLRSGEVPAVEALLRWPHPRLGAISPLEFLPLAEEAGLMTALTAWVLDRAVSQCAAWHALGEELRVAVNISSSNLGDDGFTELVAAALARHRLPASALILEITETTIIADFERCRRVIAELGRMGVHISIDDFGAGFTSLAYLGSLAVHELKLDRAFVEGLRGAEDGQDAALVRATIELGHALGLRVVAEGIEDRRTLEALSAMGCDLGQGFHIARPAPAAEMLVGNRSLRLQQAL